MIQRVKVNLIPSYNMILPVVHLKQYDKTESSEGKQIELELYSGSDVYEVPSGASVTIQGTKSDKKGYQYEVTNVEGNLVTVDIKDQMTVLSGHHYAELRITKNGSIINSTKLVMDIDSSALSDDTVISDTDLPLLQEAIDAEAVVLEKVEEIKSETTQIQTNTTDIADLKPRVTTNEEDIATLTSNQNDGTFTVTEDTVFNINGVSFKMTITQS